MQVLEQAGQMRVDPVSSSSFERFEFWSRDLRDEADSTFLFPSLQSSFELVEYVTLLREGIIEAYVGVVSALRETEQSTSFFLFLSFSLLVVPR